MLDRSSTSTGPRRAEATIESPIGPLTLLAEDGVLTGLYMAQQRHAPPALGREQRDPAAFAAATAALAAYFGGELTRFELPTRIGRPGACRAVGLANGRNPISIIVPCHRVIGAGGRLIGYGGGLPRKEQLLALEQRSLPSPSG